MGAAGANRLADNYAANNGLRGYRHCDSNGTCNAITAINTNNEDDQYELLARAIARYNTGTGNFGISWPDIIRGSADSRGNTCNEPCKYSIEIRNVRLGLPYRQYIWFGGTYPAGHANAGQDWCFTYGEEEWMNPFSIPLRQGGSRRANYNDYSNRASANDAFKDSCQ